MTEKKHIRDVSEYGYILEKTIIWRKIFTVLYEILCAS